MNYKPSFREKQEQKKLSMLAAGLISDRYPGVSSIACQLTYYQRTVNPVLMERTISFSPSSYAVLHMSCLRDGCVKGGFDLAPIINGLIKNRKTSGSGRIACESSSHSLGPDHAVLAYRVNIEYRN